MADLSIDLELSSALHGLDDLRRRQIPYATALALTRTAQAAQSEIRGKLPERFTIRSPFTERGVRIQAATKIRPEAVVYWKGPENSRFGLSLARQEVGGAKRPYSRAIKQSAKVHGRAYVALPRDVKRGAKGIIPRSQRPGEVLKRKRVFVKEEPGRGAVIMQRGAKGAAPRVLYYLDPRPARIKPRFGFRKTAEEVARRVFKREFGKAFAQAIATRRR